MLVVLGAFDFASLIISVAPSSRCAPPPLLHAAAPSAAELMLVACKVARLAEVQEMPLALRMPSTFALVDAAFEALPQVGAVAREGGPDDECQLYDALVEGLDSRLTEVCDSLGGSDGLTPQQREGLVAGVVEVLFGDAARPWLPRGRLFTQGPGTYKIPSFNDVPIDMRVSLLKDAPNARAVRAASTARRRAKSTLAARKNGGSPTALDECTARGDTSSWRSNGF